MARTSADDSWMRWDVDVNNPKLKQVYPTGTASSEDSKIDIILIHGKFALPYKTWIKQKEGSSSTHKKQFLDWTTHEDGLPSAIPGARILRFVYRGDWYGKDAIKTRTSSISTSLLDQIGTAHRNRAVRPLLFIAHSYGGLILAKALADAWQDQTRWPDVYNATVGAVFMGTPFRGTTHLLHLFTLPQIESTGEYVLPDNIESSKADNEWLYDVFSDFCQSIHKSAEDDGEAPSIACFYEREPTDLSFYLSDSVVAEQEVPTSINLYRDIVVSESSACLDNMSSTLDIRKFSRACDHLNLHRFTDLEDLEWITFKRLLQDYASNQPRLSKLYREKLIASLRYDNMGKRHASIPEPCEGTYSWIYTKSEHSGRKRHSFDIWLRSNEPTYWISGKAGSGKSVLLAHIVDNQKTLEGLKSWSGRIHLQLLSFFFSTSGSGLENNLQGLLQSFLYQLCNSQPAAVFFELVKEFHLTYGQLPSWSVSRLTRVLYAILKATETTHRYCVFIDALDESTGDQLQLLDFVTKLRQCENVKCCVSSRPEWLFVEALHSMPGFKLEDFNYDDISSFVQIAFAKAGAAEEKDLMNEICWRAEGDFLWAALVTNDVLRGFESGRPQDWLMKRISKPPLDFSRHNEDMVAEDPECYPDLDNNFPYDPLDPELEDTLSIVETAAPSIMSQQSISSQATTLDGTLVSDGLIQAFITNVICIDIMDTVLALAYKDSAIEHDRLRRNIRRMIAIYGKNLLRETTNKTEAGAARLLRSRAMSARAASTVMDYLSAKHPDSSLLSMLDGQASGTNAGSVYPSHGSGRKAEQTINWLANANRTLDDLDDEDDEDSGLDDGGEHDSSLVENSFQSLKAFLVESDAYTELKSQMLTFAHASYEKRIHGALGQDVIGIDGERLDTAAVQAVAAELSWIPPAKLSFLDGDHEISWLDHMKCFVEEHLAEKWHWWPLAPRKHPLPLNHLRMTWHSPCGEQQHIDLPVQVKDKFVSTLQTAPVFITQPTSNIPTSTPSVAAFQKSSASSSRTTGVSITTHTGTAQMSTNAATGTSITFNTPVTATTPATASPVASHFVYLCTRDGVDYRFHTLNVRPAHSDQADQQFFSDLKTEYYKARGWFRNWFSMWQYDHCQFYEFSKHALGTGEPAIIGFPADSDSKYEFRPNPMSAEQRPPKGPIKKGEFRKFFYGSTKDIDFASQCWQIFRRQQILGKIPNTGAVSLLPKRLAELQMDDGLRESFWGLYAIERRSFARVLVYFLVCNSLGIGFFFLWLFPWGHGGDLQNAAVPVQLSLSLTIGFVAVIYGTREDEMPRQIQ